MSELSEAIEYAEKVIEGASGGLCIMDERHMRVIISFAKRCEDAERESAILKSIMTDKWATRKFTDCQGVTGDKGKIDV